ncbi:aminotransferase class I/II-fold pyridoxal phosphate-dependent enzyme [candidate division KSB1 bacterium]|nr:aminotransferase class I/II-fold pyridoxal phosphate-dependent enzyme [candidate division KSB1 bacterium]
MVSFSSSANALRSSEIRRLLSLATRPDIISFAGGMPNNDLFPIKELDDIYKSLSDDLKKTGFQYGPTPGYPPLLESVKAYLKRKGLNVENNELIITTGSLQAIYLIAKVFIDPQETIITEDPCFIGAVAAFKSFQANIHGISLDENGIDIALLQQALDNPELTSKILYITPYFHNPAGIIYSQDRKNELIETLQNRDIILLEDDAYGELYFDEEDKELTTPIKSVADEVLSICYTGSFSKIFGPGMRLGWLLAPREIIEKCSLAKQGIDACTPTFTQIMANEFLMQNKLSGYVSMLRKRYAQRCKKTLAAMDQHMPEYCRWTRPKGGFYIWVTMPEHMDATKVLEKAIDRGAVFVIGSAFDPQGENNHHFRISFSHVDEDKIEQGIEMIAAAIQSVYS